MTVIAAVAVAGTAYSIYDSEQRKGQAKKYANTAQGALINLFEAWGGEEGMQTAIKASEQRLLEAGSATREGFARAEKIVGKTRKAQLASIADAQRAVEVATTRTLTAANAAGMQKAGTLGAVSTAGDAGSRAVAMDVAAQANQANIALGNQRTAVEGAAGAGLADLAVKRGGAEASILGSLANRDMNVAQILTGIEKDRSNLLSGLAGSAMSSGGGVDLSGLGAFMGYMNNPTNPMSQASVPGGIGPVAGPGATITSSGTTYMPGYYGG